MITIDELIRQLEDLKETNNLPGDSPVLIDVGSYMTEVEDVDVDASDENTIVLWCGDRVEE